MSDRDPEYAVWWMPLFCFLLLLAGLAVIGIAHRYEIDSLRKRIVVLEQKVK